MDLTDLLRDGISIVVVLGLLVGALYLVRRRGLLGGGMTPNRKLSVVDRIGLTPNHNLHMVKTERRTYLIATHQGGCTVIDSFGHDRPGPAEVAP